MHELQRQLQSRNYLYVYKYILYIGLLMHKGIVWPAVWLSDCLAARIHLNTGLYLSSAFDVAPCVPRGQVKSWDDSRPLRSRSCFPLVLHYLRDGSCLLMFVCEPTAGCLCHVTWRFVAFTNAAQTHSPVWGPVNPVAVTATAYIFMRVAAAK